MASELVYSQQIRHFRFWLDQDLRDGLRYQYALYERVYSLHYEQRRQVYQQAKLLTQSGADVLVTYDNEGCHLWLNLKHKSLSNSLSTAAAKDIA